MFSSQPRDARNFVGRPMNDSFNSDFYVTAATVIPVLYLALTLQGSTLESLLERWLKLSTREPGKEWGALSYVSFYLFTGVAITAGFAIFLSIYAEFVSLKVLYYKKSTPQDAQFVFIGITCLLILIAAIPCLKFLVVYFKTAFFGGRVQEQEKHVEVSRRVPSGLGWPNDQDNLHGPRLPLVKEAGAHRGHISTRSAEKR